MSERPALYAPCSPDLLQATKNAAKLREQTVSGFIRQAVARALGLPAEVGTYPGGTTGESRKFKKKLARRDARG